MRILIIEDEPKTSRFLKKGLSEAGYVVDVAGDGVQGLHLALEVDFDLIVLDVMLPGLDGWQVLARMREAARKTQVLMLTVRSLLRRAAPRVPETLCLADLEIDLLRHRAIRAGQKLDLTTKEFSLLTLLARRAGEVLSRTLIAEMVWDMNFDSDTNVIDVNVRRLRSKVDDPFSLKLIHTVRGAGYVLEAEP
jgi:two-component system copper resistance phosphate regulon response regulator CusR